ncbi:hypothetical protein [Tessaracoccus sp.]|uniref:hypothetical protein n=1 Tax=Tessaracoccus sp. TaxID=1971211 RepID=UPI002610A707|nr:hypothetical protein [Tessaracoccus sp.]
MLPSFTPPMHMAEAAALGVSYVYRPHRPRRAGPLPRQLPEILDWTRRLGYDALNITFPCKRAVVDLLDHVDPTALRLGSVNTVIFTDAGAVGYNTDTSGYERAFRAGLPGADLGDVVLLGAGGGVAAWPTRCCGWERSGSPSSTSTAPVPLPLRPVSAPTGTRRCAPVSPQSCPTPLPPHRALSTALPSACTTIRGCRSTRPSCGPTWVSDIVYRPLRTRPLTVARGLGCATSTADAWPSSRPSRPWN